MNRRTTRHVLLVLVAASTTTSLVACGSEDRGPTAAPSSADAATALPITEHVLPTDALPGLTADGEAEEQTPREFARAHEKDVADLRASGFLSGSTLFFNGPHGGFGISIAGQYDDHADAQAEADRLFESNATGSPGMTVEPLDVAGVPGVQAVTMTGAHRGRHYAGVEVVFVDDTVLHEVFALGEESFFQVDDVVAAVTDLHDRVAGHPVE